MLYSGRHLVIFGDEQKKRHLNIVFDSDGLFNSNTEKVLQVRISDDEDLYFLYSSCITKVDFESIKLQQGLLVDFSGFAQKVIDLLRVCFSEENNPSPKYVLKFCRDFTDKGEVGVLSIVETTNFKYLTHLSLTLTAGDDETLKAYLANQIKKINADRKSDINSLKARIAELVTSLEQSQEALRSTTLDFEKYRNDSSTKAIYARKDFEEKIKELESKHSQIKIELQGDLATQKQLASERVDELQKEFTSRINTALSENKLLREQKSELQLRLEKLMGQLQSSELQSTTLNEDILGLRSKLSTVEQTTQTQSSLIARLESKITVLESELTTKDQLLTKTQELLASEQEQKSYFQEESQRRNRQIEKVEKTLNKNNEELSKANDIIKRLQNDVKSYHNKAKLRGQVAAEQERLLTTKETELKELQTEVSRLQYDLAKTKEQSDQLAEQFRLTSINLEEAQKTIKTNETVIAWLNRQISENQIGQVQQRLKSSGYTAPLSVSSQSTVAYNVAPTYTGLNIGSRQPIASQGANFGLNSRVVTNNCTSPNTTASASYNYASSVVTSTKTTPPATGHNDLLRTISESGNGQNVNTNHIVVSTNVSSADYIPTPSLFVKSTTPRFGYRCSIGNVNTDNMYVQPRPAISSLAATSNHNSDATQNSNRNEVNEVRASKRVLDDLNCQQGVQSCKQISDARDDEFQNNLHQQSLSSAYFPKSIGLQPR